MAKQSKPFKLIPPWDVWEILHAVDGHADTVGRCGYVGAYTLKRAAQCRCCGQKMGKGTVVLKVAYDIYETGSPDPIRGLWVDCYLHKEACRNVKPITEYSYSQLA